MRKIFISPHNDDEALFGAFTIMRHREDIEVVVVYDSYIQVERGHVLCDAMTRRRETIAALNVMNVAKAPHFLGLDDRIWNGNDVAALLKQYQDCHVIFPAWEEGGNKHHNLVANAALAVGLASSGVQYTTYTYSGKSISGVRVVPAHWADISMKLMALSCYHSQINLPDCQPHFLRSQEEYFL